MPQKILQPLGIYRTFAAEKQVKALILHKFVGILRTHIAVQALCGEHSQTVFAKIPTKSIPYPYTLP